MYDIGVTRLKKECRSSRLVFPECFSPRKVIKCEMSYFGVFHIVLADDNARLRLDNEDDSELQPLTVLLWSALRVADKSSS